MKRILPLLILVPAIAWSQNPPLAITAITIQPIATNQFPIVSFPWTIPIVIDITLDYPPTNATVLVPARIKPSEPIWITNDFTHVRVVTNQFCWDTLTNNAYPPFPPEPMPMTAGQVFQKQCPVCREPVRSYESTSTFNGGRVLFLADFICPACKLRFSDSLEAVVRDTPKMEPVK